MRSLLVLLACSCFALAVAWPRSEVETRATSEPRRGGDELCADCHPSIVESYRRTGMARAIEPIALGELAQLADVHDAPADLSYRFEEGEQGPRIIESWRVADGEDGARASRSVPLAFAIGAGLLDRSYAAEIGRRLWFAPLEIVSAHAALPRHAALAPGHMVQPGTRFDTPITEECLACHTDSLPPRDYPLNLVPRDWKPRGIGCGACHGDGAAHVAWRERELAGDEPQGADPILDVASMGLHERLSICARCHLQGDARIALRAGERGVPPPGGDFLDTWAVFVPEQVDSDVAFVSHIERMVLSPCFTRSIGRAGKELSCETCHDPHVSVFDAAERERVRAACSKCHASSPEQGESACTLPLGAREGRDCASCHMRETEVFDVASVRIHDHYVRTRPGEPSSFTSVRIKHSRDGKLRRFAWPDEGASAEAEDPGLAMMAALAALHPDAAAKLVDREPGSVASTLPSYHHLRGTLLERAGRFEAARAAYERALELDPDFVESEMNLALVLMRLGDPRAAVRHCDAILARHPRAEGALRNRAIIRLAQGDPFGFAADLEAAQALLPRALVAKALAEHYRRTGDAELARAWSAEAARLGP